MGERMVALLDEAIRSAATSPRPSPSLEAGRRHAAEAVEWLRVSRAAAEVRTERNTKRLGPKLYLTLSALAAPVFRLGARRGWTWLPTLGFRAKAFLLRERRGSPADQP
jgi:hypothetical protein